MAAKTEAPIIGMNKPVAARARAIAVALRARGRQQEERGAGRGARSTMNRLRP